MRIRLWVSVLCALAILRSFTPSAVAQVADTPDPDLAIPAPIAEPAKPWANFEPKRFENAAVTPDAPWQVTVQPQAAGVLDYAMIGFSDVAAVDGTFRVEVRDEDSRLFASYDAQFLRANPRFTTPPMPSRSLIVKVVGPVAAGDLSFVIDRVLIARSSTGSLSPIPNIRLYNQMSPAERRWGRGMVKLIIADTEVCSGFLVGPRTVVTNQHCLRSSFSYANSAGQAVRQCGDIAIMFDYVAKPYTKSGNPKCVEVTNAVAPPVDVAVLKLDQPPPDVAGRAFALAASDPGEMAAPALIFEHPYGLPLGLASDCTVRATITGTQKLEHGCDTIGGASGSPILNPAGEVIGIHSNGWTDDSKSGYENWMEFYAICQAGPCPTNKGTRVSSIRAALDQ